MHETTATTRKGVHISSNMFKKIYRTGTVIFWISFLTFIVFDLAIRLPQTNDKSVFGVSDSLFMLIVGCLMTVLSTINGVAAWTMTKEDYFDLIVSTSLWGKSWYTRRAKPSGLFWSVRISSIPAMLFGMLLIVFGILGLIQLMIAHDQFLRTLLNFVP